MSSAERQVSTSRVIAAPAQTIFDIVADPTMHHVIDGSGSVKGTSGSSRHLELGDRFSTRMRIGVPYLISNKVVEFEEGRRIAWAHLGGWRWRYELSPVEGDDESTEVTETFDWSTSKASFYIDAMGWADKNLASMERTLARLDAYVTNRSASL